MLLTEVTKCTKETLHDPINKAKEKTAQAITLLESWAGCYLHLWSERKLFCSHICRGLRKDAQFLI